MDKISKIFKIVLPIYWAFLTYMLLKPGEKVRDFWFMFPNIDKYIHFGIFAMLGFSFSAAFPRMKFITFIQIMAIYALLTEIFQDVMRMGRTMETWDVVADLIGVFLGYFVFKQLQKLRVN